MKLIGRPALKSPQGLTEQLVAFAMGLTVHYSSSSPSTAYNDRKEPNGGRAPPNSSKQKCGCFPLLSTWPTRYSTYGCGDVEEII